MDGPQRVRITSWLVLEWKGGARVTAATQHSTTGRRCDPENLWYIPDRRIRTDAAADEAIHIAEQIQEGKKSNDASESEDLFKALHTCAYQATRPACDTPVGKVERRRWASRWRAIRDRIVERNLPLVRWLIAQRGSTHADRDALFSEASLALVHAVERFNPWLGYRFSTYASNAIIRAMIGLGRREQRRRNFFPVQYDASFERPTEPKAFYPQLCAERLDRVLNSNAGDLTGIESRVITERFGLERGRALTLQQTGDVVGLSKKRIRRIQYKALQKLRDALAEDPILQ